MLKTTLPKVLGFGSVYGSFIYQCTIINGQVADGRFLPIEQIPAIHPASPGINYGLVIMDRFKGCRTEDGRIVVLRPRDHLRRLADGSARIFGLHFNPEPLLDPLLNLVRLNHGFVPLYSPTGTEFLYFGATLAPHDPSLALNIPNKLTLTIFVSPVQEYFRDPLTVVAMPMQPRPFGDAKYVGNYGVYLLHRSQVRKQGFQEILHLDEQTGFVDETGAATVFLVLKDGSIFTPALTRRTILSGITRRSTIEAFEGHFGRKVIQADTTLDTILPEVVEAFACGTAVTIAPIDTLFYPDFPWRLSDSLVDYRDHETRIWRFRSSSEDSVTRQLRDFMVSAYTGKSEKDIFNWNVEVEL